MAHLPHHLPQQLKSTRALVRFGLRLVILVVFAAYGGLGFGKSLVALLWMSALLSGVIAAVRREPPFDTVLNHWDETAAYAALCCLVSAVNYAVPV